MQQTINERFRKVSEWSVPQIIRKGDDGKEYGVTVSHISINPLKEQGYHAVYRVFGTSGNDEIYGKTKTGILASVNSKIGEQLRKFNDGIGEMSVSPLEAVDCPFNNGGISHMMRFSTEGVETSGIILLNFYNYPDDVLVEMSIWSVDYSKSDDEKEVVQQQQVEQMREITVKERETKRKVDSVDWLWKTCEKVRFGILNAGIFAKIVLAVVFLVTVIPFFAIYAVLAIIYGILYYFKHGSKIEIPKDEPKTRVVVTYDWSGIRALTQIRHLNFVKQKAEEAISEYLEGMGFKWEQGMVANYKPELLKEGMAKTISQSVNNNFNLDFSKTVEIGNGASGGDFQIGSVR